MLEASMYSDNAFLTLTYNDDSLPEGGTLNPADLRNFWKRLRNNTDKFRYFAVGEYGDKTQRPHYHAILFGFPTCSYGQSRYNKRTIDCCFRCDLVRDTWQLGNILLGTVTRSSAQYCAAYTTKKLTNGNDQKVVDWLNGRHPEFSRCSNRPGIGADAMWDIASGILETGQEKMLRDVPVGLNYGNRQWPLGRYLRVQLRKMLGRDEKTPQSVLNSMEEELRDVYSLAVADAEELGSRETVPYFFRHRLEEMAAPRAIQLAARERIFKKRVTL